MEAIAQKLAHEINLRYRPLEGWSAVGLLILAVVCVASATIAVGWVSEDGVVIPAVIVGTVLGMVFAKRPLHGVFAWLLISIYILLVTLIYLANLLPPLRLLINAGEPLRQYWLQNGGFFVDRMGSWLVAVAGGGSSQETIAFAFGLGILGGFFSAYAAWATFRLRKPLLGLAILGLLLAINSYYGRLDIWWVSGYVGIVALVTAVLHFANLEQKWQTASVDYSDQLRWELMLYASLIAVMLLAISTFLPSFRISEIRDTFWELTAVVQTDESIGRAFAGVEQPRRPTKEPSRGRIGGEGIMPRNYLLGLAPELAETVMMTATVSVQDSAGEWMPAPAELLDGSHWRSLSYQDYTGRGWVISEERREETMAETPLQSGELAATLTLKQSIFWQKDDRITRYSLGLPTQFDQDTTTAWRGLDDLVRVWGEGNEYVAQSRISLALPTTLQQTAVSEVSAPIKARYTELPESVPQRVHDLAQEIAGGYDNPYDQARALEQFLRQYPYSLDVDLPPENVDPVDYFLFDLQRGYCDYYASSMVVMARSLGLPARMAVGFLSQDPDENGVQTIYQLNGHSWAEIYFPEYGWVEFEPTGAFASPRDVTQNYGSLAEQYIPDLEQQFEEEFSYPSIPERAPNTEMPWTRIILLVLFAVALLFVWGRQRRRKKYRNQIEWAYGNWQQQALHLNQNGQKGATVYEFMQQSIDELSQLSHTPKSAAQINELQKQMQDLSEVYVHYQYAPTPLADGEETAVSAWRAMKRPLRWLKFKQKFQRKRRK